MQKTISSTIVANNKIFTVREDFGRGMRVPDAFSKYKGIIRHKDLDFLYTDQETRQKYWSVLSKINPIISRLMGASSMLNGEILPLGDLQKDEKGIYYMEGAFRGETTRFNLFTEAQAKTMEIDLKKPAFAAIEDGYNIVDCGKDSYVINVPENALPNLRLFYGKYENVTLCHLEHGQLRYVEQEFGAPFGELASFLLLPQLPSVREQKIIRCLYYYKPGPAVRGDGNLDDYFGSRFDVSFGYVVGRDYCFGVVTENSEAAQNKAADKRLP